MAYSLNNFCDGTRATLRESDDSAGREKIRRALEQLLTDQAFCAEHAGADYHTGMKQIFEDASLNF